MRTRFAALLVVIGVGAFYLSTLRSGHDWGDDFSLYILHAKNIAHGVDYSQTGFIYNPAYPEITWEEPPVFPLLLAPVVRAFGVNLHAMQIEVVGLFLLALGAIFLAFRTELPPVALIGLLAAVGFNFFFWQAKQAILADAAFVFFTYLCFYVSNLVYRNGLRSNREWFAAAVVGLAVYAAYATRTVGIVLLPSVVLIDLLRYRRLSRFQAGVIGVFGACATLQGLALGDAVNYDVGFFIQPLGITTSAPYYAGWLSILFWTAGRADPLFTVPYVLVGALALWGLVGRRRNPSHGDVFIVLYSLAIAVWDSHRPEARFLLPIAPLYLFYAFTAIGRVRFLEARSLLPAAQLTLVVVMLAGSASAYAQVETGPLTAGVDTPSSRELFDFVKATPRDSVFIFRKPRALTLFGERSASVYDVYQTGQDLTAYMGQIHATHIIESTVFIQDQQILRPYIEQHAQTLRLVFANTEFRVYELRQRQ